jgi:GMP synthase-like glutamine amidotransferase
MKIGILETGTIPRELTPRHGGYKDLFARLLDGNGFTYDLYRVEDGVLPERVDAADGWLITGSRHGAYEPHPWIPPLEAFIRESLEAGVPMVGICFGHQIMAQALGGKVEKFTGGWAVGAREYAVAGSRMQLIAWHQDQVVEKPESAVCVASGEGCEFAALAYGRTGLSIQPHPEFDPAFSHDLLAARGNILPQHIQDEARPSFDTELSTGRAARMIADFFIENRRPQK